MDTTTNSIFNIQTYMPGIQSYTKNSRNTITYENIQEMYNKTTHKTSYNNPKHKISQYTT